MTCPACMADLETDAAYCSACGYRMRAKRGSLVGITLNDRYRIDARLAAGGFGAIYRATHIVTGTQVALKVLHSDLASDPNLSARFRREGATLANLRDPHTVATYELGEAPDGTLYIAMELLRGDSLWDRFRVAGVLPWRKVLTIIKGVLSSLTEAHALGIVHRDLKPANIHLEPSPEPDFVKVLDFGIAKLMSGSSIDDGSELTRVGTAVGTLDYMSPEQLVGSPCDGRTDIYTLGVVMYEMITGQRPFADASGPTSLITALFTRNATPPSVVANVPPFVDGVILKCLEREPSDRFTDVHELRAAIDRVLAMSSLAPSTIKQITTLPGGHQMDRGMFGIEEITIRERPIAPELIAQDAPNTDVENIDDLLPTLALGEDTTVIDRGRLPTAPTEYAAGSEALQQVQPPQPTQSAPAYAEGSATYAPHDMWQGSNLTLVWPPVLPQAVHDEPSSPFEIALGSTVGPPPAPVQAQAHLGPSGTMIREPSMSLARIVLIGVFLLMIGMVIGVTVAYLV